MSDVKCHCSFYVLNKIQRETRNQNPLDVLSRCNLKYLMLGQPATPGCVGP